MDALHDLMDFVVEKGLATENLLGLLHILIGRSIQKADGTPIANGLTWRDSARLLKKVRWDPEAVRQLNIDPASLPPRDRERYWFIAVTQAGVASDQAVQAADRLAQALRKHGYVVGPAPGKE